MLCVHAQLLSRVRLFAALWAIPGQAPLSMGFSRQEYWSGLPFPFLRDLPDPGIKPASLTFPALAVRFFSISTTWEAQGVTLTNISALQVGLKSLPFYLPLLLQAEVMPPSL